MFVILQLDGASLLRGTRVMRRVNVLVAMFVNFRLVRLDFRVYRRSCALMRRLHRDRGRGQRLRQNDKVGLVDSEKVGEQDTLQ